MFQSERGKLRNFLAACVLCALAVFSAGPVAAADSGDPAEQAATLSALRDSDARLNAIFWRLATANAVYCDPAIRATGLVLHARSAYVPDWRAAADRLFGFEGEVGVEAIDPDSPAARSGVVADDTLVAVAGVPLGSETGPDAVAAAYAQLAQAGRDGAVTVTVLRKGQPLDYRIDTVPSCSQRIELYLTSTKNARTDGEIIQINSAFMNMGLNDDRLASIIAHELGHLVLHHPDRLEAAGAYRGLGGLLGGKRRLIRRTEDEADQISPWLMYNAGYDPEAAAAFWRAQHDSILTDPSHPQPSQRTAMIEAEIRKLRQAGPPPVKPPFIDGRDRPLTR